MTISKLTWRAAAITDRGLKRADNQDNLFVSDDERLFVIADGMGGADNGQVASRLAVETFKSRWQETVLKDEDDLRQWLRSVLYDANDTISSASGEVELARRMGTTVVAAAHKNDGTVEIAHVGDSRAYLIRGKKIRRLTTDHSVVMEMVVRKQLTEEQAFHSVYRNLLTQCLGHDRQIDPDEISVEVQSGDWIVLCSDGLNSVMKDDEIARIVCSCRAPEEVCKKLLAGTYKHQAPDNVTIVAIHYE